jgi:hypothetical protein
MRKAIANYEQSERLMGRMLWERRVSTKEFDADGRTRAERTMLVRRETMEGLPVSHVVERNGKPIEPAESAKQQTAIRKAIDEFRALPPDQQAKRLEGQPGREMEFLREMPDALDYKYVRSEMADGREVLEFDMFPREGYKPKNIQARIFAKVRGKVWVDKAAEQIQRCDAEVFETVSLGGFLARVDKDTQFHIRRIRTAEGVWLPQTTRVKFGAKVMLVKNIRQESESQFSGFRPWREHPNTPRQ